MTKLNKRRNKYITGTAQASRFREKARGCMRRPGHVTSKRLVCGKKEKRGKKHIHISLSAILRSFNHHTNNTTPPALDGLLMALFFFLTFPRRCVYVSHQYMVPPQGKGHSSPLITLPCWLPVRSRFLFRLCFQFLTFSPAISSHPLIHFFILSF